MPHTPRVHPDTDGDGPPPAQEQRPEAVADSSGPKKRSCGLFCAFFVFGMLIVPILVFMVGALFAAILYGVECPWARELNDDDDLSEGICSFYQWWLYIVGNLVGLGNPLTDVGPISGHALAEIIDLLVAVCTQAPSRIGRPKATCFLSSG